MSGYESLHVEREGAVVRLVFDHGKANEIGSSELAQLARLTEELERGSASALITSSRKRSRKGTPIFVAGANVTERSGWDDEAVRYHVRRQRQILAALRAAPVFHVAVVEGVALGWGTEFMLCADWRIACDGAVFGLPETGLGILPGAGGTSELWSEVGVAHALRLGMTGERIGPDEALRIGLVQERCADGAEGLRRAEELASMAARRSPTAMAAFKQAVLAAVGTPPLLRQEAEARAYEHCLDSGDAAIGREHFAAIRRGERPPWRER